MIDKDKEAFEKWYKLNFLELDKETGLAKMQNDFIKAWRAACEYKQKEIDELRVKLNVCKNDYWFMINLIERYSSNKDQALKDCLERMKFRKGLFNILGDGNNEPEK